MKTRDWILFFAVYILLCGGTFIAAFAISADKPDVTLPPLTFEVLRFQFHDVDTVRGDVRLPWGAGILDKSIRANGFDGWEVDKTRKGVAPFSSFTEAQWSVETAKGEKARDEVRALAKGGRVYVQWNIKDENSVYGRIEGPLWIVKANGEVVELRSWAILNGHVRK